MSELFDFITKEIKKRGIKSILSSFSREKKIKEEIIQDTLFLNEYNPKMSERIYCIVNNITSIKKCKYCGIKKVNFLDFSKGYNTGCSLKCSHNSKNIKEKRKKTCMEKYGVEHPLQNKEVMKKVEDTNFKKYGTKYILQDKKMRERIEKTNIEKYGFKTPLQNETIKNKIKETVALTYGVDNVSKSNVVKAQKTATTFSNYGVLYPLQSSLIMDKMENTMIETYGVRHNSYRKETLKNRENTWTKIYGIKNPIFINNNRVSKMSQKLFWSIYEKLPDELKNKCYFSELNKEFDIEDGENKIHYLYDFVISNIKMCVEFNGDYWHCNPKKYSENYENKIVGKTAIEIWKNDDRKIEFLKNKGYDVFVAWEKEYKKTPGIVLENILRFVNNKFCFL